METFSANTETNVVDSQPTNGQFAGANAPTLPLPPEPANAPPATPTQNAPSGFGWLPSGGALWMAFLFGVACNVVWSLIGTLIFLLLYSLEGQFNFGLPLSITNIISVAVFVLVLAPVVGVLAVAGGQTLRGAGAARRAQALVALVFTLLLSVALGLFLPYLLPVFALQYDHPSPAQPGLALLASGLVPVGLGSQSFTILSLFQSAFLLALPAAYVWGRAARTGETSRWLALVRWMIVGLSALVGYLVLQVMSLLVEVYFLKAPPQALLERLALIIPMFVLGCVAALVGGALALPGRGITQPGAGADRQPVNATMLPQQTRRMRQFWLVGAIAVALGLLTSLGILGAFYLGVPGPSVPLPFVALILLPLVIPALSMLAALIFAVRRLGVFRWLVAFVLMVCSLATSLVIIVSPFAPDSQNTLNVLFDPATTTTVFGIALGLGIVFSRASTSGWRVRAASTGWWLGLGFAFPFAVLVVAFLIAPPGQCFAGACGLPILYPISLIIILIEQLLEGLALALVGATLGGWLRASRRT